MSEQDRSERLDEDQFTSLDGEPIDGFADFEADFFEDAGVDESSVEDVESLEFDIADDGTEAAGDVEAEDPLALDVPPPPPAATKRRRKTGRAISSFELGFIYTISLLVAAVGVGGACLLVTDVDPVGLWQPAQLLNLQSYSDLANNPLNLLAIVLLGAVGLTLLGTWAIVRATTRANRRVRLAENTLDQITSLRLDAEEAWMDPGFKSDPAVAAFTSEVLGAWRLQSARQKRSMGLEGELHRLEKALADNSRSDLTGRFDHPAVGVLADEMVRYFDERTAVAKELEEIRSRNEGEAISIISLIQDARSWQQATLAHVGAQGAVLDRVARRLQDEAAKEQGHAAAAKDASTLLAEIRQELTDQPEKDGKPAGLDDLVDKGSKLAFQIAMEVARLGPRGERLSPLSQSLEELTTDIRLLVDQMNASAAGQGSDDLSRVRGKMVDLSHRLAEIDGSGDDLVAEVGRTVSTADEIAANLAEISRRFQAQAERLVKLGEAFAAMTGIAFDPSDLADANPDNPPEGSLLAGNPDPFGRKAEPGQPEVDPFATEGGGGMDKQVPSDPDFSRETLPSSAFEVSTEKPAADPLVIDYSFGVKPAVPENPAPAPAPLAEEPAASGPDTDLPVEEEKVYDLEDFGAAAPMVEDAEPVHELSDFGATSVGDDQREAPVQELADFGAVRIDGGQDQHAADTGSDADRNQGRERIYDLAEFGAVPVS